MQGSANGKIFEAFGVSTIINAKGPATRLSGGIMRREVAEAMAEASQACVDIAELQAGASRYIAEVTGAEAGYVASGASASLLLAAAAAMAGLDPGRMARLPDARGGRHEIVMVRSQRNFYDHAIRAAGATIVEAGLPDRYAGAGVRDAEAWEIEDAISERTAAVYYVADRQARPPLGEICGIAKRSGIPVIVDAAAQLPPQSNLRRFIDEGADLVAFSGGKALGGPQASGFLCGRRDLIMSAALQHLDLDVHADMWMPPPSLIDKHLLKGTPQHGIGRGCKAGKEEIVGLLAALRFYVEEGDAARHQHWCALLEDIRRAIVSLPGVALTLHGASDQGSVPVLALDFEQAGAAARAALTLQQQSPAIHVDAFHRGDNRLDINPMCLRPRDIVPLTEGLKAAITGAGIR